MTTYEQYNLILVGIGTFIAFLGLLFIYKQLRALHLQIEQLVASNNNMVTANNSMAASYNQVAQINRQNHDWNRRHTTQEFLTGIIDNNFHDLNVNFNFTYRKDTIKMSEIDKALEADPSIKSKINNALNFYELVCVGLKNGVLDEMMVRDSIESAIKQTYRVFTEYIEDMQKTTPRAFIVLEQTATKWNAEDRSFLQRPHTA